MSQTMILVFWLRLARATVFAHRRPYIVVKQNNTLYDYGQTKSFHSPPLSPNTGTQAPFTTARDSLSSLLTLR